MDLVKIISNSQECNQNLRLYMTLQKKKEIFQILQIQGNFEPV